MHTNTSYKAAYLQNSDTKQSGRCKRNVTMHVRVWVNVRVLTYMYTTVEHLRKTFTVINNQLSANYMYVCLVCLYAIACRQQQKQLNVNITL